MDRLRLREQKYNKKKGTGIESFKIHVLMQQKANKG